jgi:hypothetical protein
MCEATTCVPEFNPDGPLIIRYNSAAGMAVNLPKSLRNRSCRCGSGKKTKKCHPDTLVH